MAKIFIIEDDPLLVKMYKKAFNREGYEVETAFDGREGLKKLNSFDEKPTLILSDVMMPEINGLEFLNRIKEKEELKNVPVVMLTNLAGESDARRALELGAVLYLIKSQYKPKEVVEKVKEVIGGYTREKEIPKPSVPVRESEITEEDNEERI